MAELDKMAANTEFRNNFEQTAKKTEQTANGENEVMKKLEEEIQFSLDDIAEEHIDNTVESDQLHFKKSAKVNNLKIRHMMLFLQF